MSNIIDKIRISGVTYELQGSGGGITSGEVQNMIDSSISGKVNVSDNEVSGLTVANEITTNVNYNYGDISDFWIKDTASWAGSSIFSFKSINSSSSTGNCTINYYHSSQIITSVSSSSGNFTYQIVDGKLHITFNNGYSLHSITTINAAAYCYYVNSYQGGQSADVIEGSINDALNDTNKRIVENALTGVSINLANGTNYLAWTQYYKSRSADIKSVTLSDGKTIKYDNGLYVNFSGSTTHTVILNTGSGGYCNSPSTPPSTYADSYSEMSVGFNSSYTGSTTSFTLTFTIYSSSNQYSTEAYTYDSTTNTLSANGQSYKTSFTKDGYNALFTPIEGYRISRINLNPCKIAGIDVVDKSPYIITSVTAPSYNYNGQEMIDAINTTLSGKQDTLSAGTGISISGNVISATGGGGGNPTVELTQAEYDALVSAGTVSADTYYIITDAQSPDITQYWTSAQTQSAINQATSGKVNTSAVVSSVTSASTDSEIPTAKAVFDAIPTGGTGGGKAISAGTNISVTTGETADTINCTLPIYVNPNTPSGDITFGKGIENSESNYYKLVIGQNIATIDNSNGSGSIGIGVATSSSSDKSLLYGSSSIGIGRKFTIGRGTDINSVASSAIAIGYKTNALYTRSIAIGGSATTNANNSVAIGANSVANAEYSFNCGKYNASNTGSTDADNTLFSVGNGTDDNARHNAFEIRQNGDVYLSYNGNDVKLQDLIADIYSKLPTS